VQQSICVLEVRATLGRTSAAPLVVALPLARPRARRRRGAGADGVHEDLGAVQYLGFDPDGEHLPDLAAALELPARPRSRWVALLRAGAAGGGAGGAGKKPVPSHAALPLHSLLDLEGWRDTPRGMLRPAGAAGFVGPSPCSGCKVWRTSPTPSPPASGGDANSVGVATVAAISTVLIGLALA